jgi:peptide chain release factor subunit 1
VTELDHTLLRKLAGWSPDGVPVTSLYLTVDGRRYPRRTDYGVRLDELLRSARTQALGLPEAAARSVEGDLAEISRFVRERFERGSTRGLALFSASAVGLWEEIALPRPVRDRAVVGPRADVRMLEALLETYEPTCVALVDYEKARLFLSQLGRVEEVRDLADEVPGRHDQGGWAQMRMQRHVDDHRMQHLKHVADALFRLWQGRGFAHLVLAGPGEAHRELEGLLHEYLRQRVRAHLSLSMTATIEDVRVRTLEVEEELERAQEAATVERLVGAIPSGGGVGGPGATLGALSEGRVGTLIVGLDVALPGGVCDRCGRLGTQASTCPTCGSPMREVPDVVEVAVATAYERGCEVETVTADERLERLGGIGALLRF